MEDTRAVRLSDPIDSIAGIGPRTAKAYNHLGISTVGDLMWHLPSRYEHEQAEMTIAQAEDMISILEGSVENISIRGEIAAIRSSPGRGGRIEATVEDSSGSIQLVWFNAPWIRNSLRPGVEICAEGRAKRWKGYLQLSNPTWSLVGSEDSTHTGREEQHRPVYPASEDLSSKKIHTAIESVLDSAVLQINDPLPNELRIARALPPLADAIRMMHRPSHPDEVPAARRRLAYDELLLLQLGVMMKRRHLRSTLLAPALELTPEIDKRIRARFPFTLTPDQDNACAEIASDLGADVPMNRLLQGDVGSGKTAVALHAMLLAAAHGHQAVLLAPTELLAEQHYASIQKMLAGSDVTIDLLTGTMPTAERRELRTRISSGESHLLIGTHALLSDDIAFHNLGLVIIDEQHRFGVEQRARLRKPDSTGLIPHVLVMTATPIPRTLSLTVFGDLDVTVIRHRPPGRQAVISRVVAPDQSDRVYEFLAERVAAGEQGYVVVPAIDESGLGLKDVGSHSTMLAKGPLRSATIDVIHGRLDRGERELVMEKFRSGKTDVLVATVVIEVGVDVPNATTMIIEHAERFGLAQLHQLRGRVGRGTARSVCAFISEPTTEEGIKRLEAISSTEDGFKIAELDLGIRGPGELFGARQSGLPPFRIADLIRDLDLLRMARADADQWIEKDPRLEAANANLVRDLLMKKYGPALGLGDVG